MEKTDKNQPIAAGKSSYELLDSDKVFGSLPLKKGITFLDVACGRGQYSIHASEFVGSDGIIHAVDLWEEGVRLLEEQIAAKGITNIRPAVADASKRLPVEDNSIDMCLLSTVLHDFVVDKNVDGVLREVARVLKDGAVLAIIEFKKVDDGPGPPIHIRMSADEVENLVAPLGFRREHSVDVGPHNYMTTFTRVACVPES